MGIALLAAVLLGHALILLRRPVVGAAENGDFRRVLQPAGLVSLDAQDAVAHRYVSQTYGVAAPALGNWFSSAALIAVAATALAPGASTFDIRQLGAAYLLLYGIAFAAALCAGVPAVLCALLAWAGLDVSYSLYCNSFFADPAALLGLLGVVLALLVEDRGSRRRAACRRVALVVAALLAGFSKNLYMLTPWLLAAGVLIWPRRAWTAHLRREAPLLGALTAAGALTVWHFTLGSGYRFPEMNHHQVVFCGVVAVADDLPQVLAELGVDPRYAVFAGRTFYQLSEEEQAASATALAEISRARVAGLYAEEPRRIARAMWRVLPALRETRTADPNFADHTQPPGWYGGWWQFARLRGALPLLAALLLAAGAAVSARAAAQRTWRGAHTAFSFLLANAVLLVVGSVLGDGFVGISRHTMGARFSLDLALALVAYTLYARVARVIRGRG